MGNKFSLLGIRVHRFLRADWQIVADFKNDWHFAANFNENDDALKVAGKLEDMAYNIRRKHKELKEQSNESE